MRWVNLGQRNEVDEGNRQTHANAKAMFEVLGKNAFGVPHSTDSHRVFVSEGGIFATERDPNSSGKKVITRRIGVYDQYS